MKSEERRKLLIDRLENAEAPLSGSALARELCVSRQVIVNDIAILRAAGNEIMPTSRGYVLSRPAACSRVIKVCHNKDDVETEMNAIVDLGGTIKDIFVYHKAYGVVRGTLNVRSRLDVQNFVEKIHSGKSSLLSEITAGYHYHTILAKDEATLDMIENRIWELGFLAKLQPYEPLDLTSQG